MPRIEARRLALQTVLVPLDGSLLAEHALSAAVAIARGAGARIELVLAGDPLRGPMPRNAHDRHDVDARVYVTGTARLLREHWGIAADGRVLHGDAADVICECAAEIDADLIVMASHRRTGLNRVWHGSIMDRVVRESSRPVLITRGTSRPITRDAPAPAAPSGSVLVPIDGSLASAAVLTTAIAVARCSLANVTLLHVVEPVPMLVMEPDVPLHTSSATDPDATALAEADARMWLTELAQNAERESGASLRSEVRIAGAPAQCILDVARECHADLIAMTTHGRGASRLVLGSVSDAVLRGTDASLLLLHPLI